MPPGRRWETGAEEQRAHQALPGDDGLDTASDSDLVDVGVDAPEVTVLLRMFLEKAIWLDAEPLSSLVDDLGSIISDIAAIVTHEEQQLPLNELRRMYVDGTVLLAYRRRVAREQAG